MAVKITANGISKIQDNIITASKIKDNGIAHVDLPSGAILQVVKTISSVKTSFTVGTSDTVCPNMTLSITPKETGSNFVITCRLMMEVANSWDTSWNLQKDGVRVNAADSTNNSAITMGKQTYNGAGDNSSTPEMIEFTVYDNTQSSVAGTPITYRLVACSNAARTCYTNSTWANDDNDGNENGASEIIIWEVKG